MNTVYPRIRDERGQAMMLTAVFMAVLLGMAGLVLDVGSWYRAQRATQAAADAAALAGAQALPYRSGDAYTWANQYAVKNGGGLADITFDGRYVANDTISVSLEREAPGFFARLFDIDKVKVRARASARAWNVQSARWVAPIVVDEKHPKLQCDPNPCSGSVELKYQHLKANGTPDGSGSFGFINLRRQSDNPGTSELGEWIRNGFNEYMKLDDYQARTGNPFSSSHIRDSLQAKIGEEILFPVYRKLKGTGSGAKYEIIGWVGFHLTGFNLQGNNERLYGWFTQFIAEGIQSETGSGPNFGVRAIELVE